MATNRPATPITINTTATPQAQDAPSEGMSPKTRQTIAIGGLLLCLLIGAGIVYWLLFGTSPKNRTVTVNPQEQTSDMGNRGQVRFSQPRRQQMIVKEDDTTWRATGPGSMMVVKSQGGGFDITLNYTGRDFLSSDQKALISGFVRARNDQAMATEWGISPDQVTQLKNIHLGGAPVPLSSSESQELQTLWKTYNSAADGTAKSDAEKAVIKRMDELAKAHLDDTRKVFASKVDEIKKILTPEQVQKISGK